MNYPQFIPTGYRKPVNIAVLLAVIAVAYFVGKKLKMWGKPKLEGASVSTDPNKKPPKPGFNAANEVSKLADLLSATWDGGGEDEKAFETILNYVDNEVVLVHNEWRERYAGGQFWQGIKATLRMQINAEVLGFWRKTAIDKKNLVLKKLDRLNL